MLNKSKAKYLQNQICINIFLREKLSFALVKKKKFSLEVIDTLSELSSEHENEEVGGDKN